MTTPAQFTTGAPATWGDVTGALTSMMSAKREKAAEKLANRMKKLKNFTSPGWQFFKRVLIFAALIGFFAIFYYIEIKKDKGKDHKDPNVQYEWSFVADENGDPIMNPLYTSTVVTSTIGYGDYYPLTQRGMILIVFHILITWITFSWFLS